MRDTYMKGNIIITFLSYLAFCLAVPAQAPFSPSSNTCTHAVITVAVRGTAFEFVRVPPGEFLMGSEEYDIEAAREFPMHKVHIKRAFDLGKTEVTVGQFKAFVEATGYRTDGEKIGWAWGRDPRGDPRTNLTWKSLEFPITDAHPVICSWNDAQAFCRWLSGETRSTFRLPSEAEWEYACRAGTKGEYPDADTSRLFEIGWHMMNSRMETHPVALKPPNAWGLFDMQGNVWEWCADLFHSDYTGAPVDGSPWLEGGGKRPDYSLVFRMARGGAYNRPYTCMRAGCRQSAPENTASNFGFRLVREK
jgi:formylglycine-generating enzyme required for sulfatase activity